MSELSVEVNAMLGQVMQLAQSGQLPAALSMCRQAADEYPHNSAVLFCQGWLLLQDGQHQQASDCFQRVLELEPRHAMASNNRGAALLHLQRYDEAIIAFRTVLDIDPEHVGAMANLGRCLIRTNSFEMAVDVLEAALARNPRHAGAWADKGLALQNLGRFADAEEAIRQSLEILPDSAPALNSLGICLMEQGSFPGAAEAFSAALKVSPEMATAHFNLAAVYRQQRRVADEYHALQAAIRCQPDYAEAHYNLGFLYQSSGDLRAAEAAYRRAIDVRRDYIVAWHGLAIVLLSLNDTDAAEAVLLEALALDAGNIDIIAALALLHEQSGHLPQADDYVRRGLALQPDHAGLNLTAAKMQRRRGELEQAIERLQAVELDDRDGAVVTADIYYELGFLFDRLGKYDKSYDFSQRANDVFARWWQPRVAESEAYFRMIGDLRRVFDALPGQESWFQRIQGDPDQRDPNDGRKAPVFLVGFPRSGTTLLDKVLNGHSGIVTIEEQPMIAAVENWLSGQAGGYPGCLPDLTAGQVRQARQQYFAEADKHATLTGDQILIDKLPINSARAGLIWRLFPDARFILAIRHPCDVCLSCFRQNFSVNGAMAHFFTLESTVELYVEVMSAWQHYVETLPIVSHRVRYEDLVDDLEQEARHLIRFLGLDWQPGVLNYIEQAKKAGRINTPSYTQVMQPIYRDARFRWQHYEARMGSCIAPLQPFIERFGY